MAISTTIPTNWKLPLFWAVVDGSQAGNLTESQPAILVGQAFLGGDAAVAPKTGGNTGNGTFALDNATPVLSNAILGIYKAVFSSATAFTVKDPNAATVGTGTVGTNFANQVKFTITAGATAFAASDEFDITVAGLPTGAASYNIPVAIGSDAVGQQQFGTGSMLSRMITTFLQGNTTQQLWCLPIPKPTAGTKATGSIKIATPPTSSGVLYEYIAGQQVAVTVYSTDTPASVATNLTAAINALNTLPVKAVVDGSDPTKVDLTCRWHGLTGNDITLCTNYLGLFGGEQLPAGLTLTTTPMSGGTGNPDFTAAIAAIQSKQFYHFGIPYTDTGSMQIWNAELGFGPTGRWNYTRQQYGWMYTYNRNDYSDALTFGLAQNSPVISMMALEPTAPTPVWEWTAGYCAQASAALLDDPARPLQTLEIPGCLPATVDQRFSQAELNNLCNSGYAIQGVAPDGNPMILREQLQYQFNQYGQADTAFALVTILSNLAELLSRLKQAITSNFPRHKLAPDGTAFGPGQAIVTPKIIKGVLVACARRAEYDGLMSNVSFFIKNLIVEIDDNDPNRVNVLWPPQLMGQLRSFDVLAQFRLNEPTFSLT